VSPSGAPVLAATIGCLSPWGDNETAAGAVTVWPLSANAQRAENLTRIGFLPVNPYDRSLVDAFRQGLREVGVIENRDVVLDIIWIGAEAELPQAVSDLVRRGAKLLIPAGTSASIAVKRGVSTIPILFINVGNPVGVGLVESLAGANVTGFSDMHADLSGKYVQFAREFGEPQGAVNYLVHRMGGRAEQISGYRAGSPVAWRNASITRDS
jgi:ABC transporter substrate binding protein